ncbi:MAG: ABC-2 transporter permease [Eggerthellaceae bacterium]
MLLRDQRRDWVAFRQALPLSRANVVAGRYASIAIVVAGCVALSVAAYTTACIVNAVVPGLPLVRHFAVGFDAAGVVSFAAGTFALTIAMFSVLLPFMFADSHRKLASYIPFAFMLALMGWIYIFRSMNFDAFLPLVGRIVVAAQSLGGALVVGGCVTAAALALYVVSERAAVRGYATRDL